ncbi:glycosyltransferase family 4 protein [Dokdonella sp.]|uniref:glycosyltransferase family 4 protein n=1 Tax=Dokdonella sp. TaxID=2291710 RepID=UPI003C441ECF
MRVAIVTETWPPEVNGVALTVQSLARGLVRLGHEVEVIRPRSPQDADLLSANEFDELLVGGAALPRYPGLRFGLPSQSRLLRRWRNARPQVMYVATEGPLGHSALAAGRKLGIPACTGFHTRFDDFIGHYGFPWLTPLVFAGMRRFHNRAAATLVPTAELATFLEKNRFRNVRVLRRAVDTELFHPARRDLQLRARWGLDHDQLAVVHVGRLAAEKNLNLAVRAFRQIQATQPEARFVIVGDGPERARIAEANPDFIFAGLRRGKDLACHYASGDLFLFPSTTETFGNVTLEAMASGVPVVAFDYGAAREHIVDQHTGCRVPLANQHAFIHAAIALADDSAARNRIGHAARLGVSALSPESVSTSFADLLVSLDQEKAA